MKLIIYIKNQFVGVFNSANLLGCVGTQFGKFVTYCSQKIWQFVGMWVQQTNEYNHQSKTLDPRKPFKLL
jgi:hypothetical protein